MRSPDGLPFLWKPPQYEPLEVRAVEYGGPIEHPLLVTTAPRPHGHSLFATLDSLKRAGLDGWRGPLLMEADGYLPTAPGWITRATPEPEGSTRCLLRGLELAMAYAPDLTQLTICQDDVALCLGALDYIQRVRMPPIARLAAYFSEGWPGGEQVQPSWGLIRGRQFMDAQLITLTRQMVEALLAFNMTYWGHRHSCDILISRVDCGDWLCAIHGPSLAQHTEGENSACEHSSLGPRLSPSFVGEDFNARGWLP